MGPFLKMPLGSILVPLFTFLISPKVFAANFGGDLQPIVLRDSIWVEQNVVRVAAFDADETLRRREWIPEINFYIKRF